MDWWNIILGIAIIIGAWYADSKIRGYQFTISELRDENRRLEKNLEITESSKEWLSKLYDDLLEKHYEIIEKYNIQLPIRDEEEESNDTNSALH